MLSQGSVRLSFFFTLFSYILFCGGDFHQSFLQVIYPFYLSYSAIHSFWCISQGFTSGSDGKASVCNAGDPGSIPGLERSPREGNGSPLQYSCLENPMDHGAWQVSHLCLFVLQFFQVFGKHSLHLFHCFPEILNHLHYHYSEFFFRMFAYLYFIQLFFWDFTLSLLLGHNYLLFHPD